MARSLSNKSAMTDLVLHCMAPQKSAIVFASHHVDLFTVAKQTNVKLTPAEYPVAFAFAFYVDFNREKICQLSFMLTCGS